MPLINLIYEQRQLVRQRERQVRMLVLATLGLGAMSFLAAGFYVFEAARYQVMVGGLEAKKRALDPMLKQLESNQRDQAQLEPKLTTLSSATKATEQWSKIMTHLTTNVPKSVWLNNIKCNQQPDQDGGINLSLAGYSTNHDEIGEFLLRLEACPELESVTLKFTQERLLDKGIKVLEFEVSAYLAGSRNQKKIKEKDAT